MKTRGVYAGSFDLLTVGHVWMIRQGADLFDDLVIGIGVNPDKKPMFSVEERYDQIVGATEDIENIYTIEDFSGYLFNFAQRFEATHLLRGIRNNADMEYERTMRNLNEDFSPILQTVFLMPPRDLAEVSSSVVKGLIGPDGWQDIIAPLVPPNVLEELSK